MGEEGVKYAGRKLPRSSRKVMTAMQEEGREGSPLIRATFPSDLTEPRSQINVLTCSAEGLSEMTSDASRSALDAFCSPSAAITCKKGDESEDEESAALVLGAIHL